MRKLFYLIRMIGSLKKSQKWDKNCQAQPWLNLIPKYILILTVSLNPIPVGWVLN